MSHSHIVAIALRYRQSGNGDIVTIWRSDGTVNVYKYTHKNVHNLNLLTSETPWKTAYYSDSILITNWAYPYS